SVCCLAYSGFFSGCGNGTPSTADVDSFIQQAATQQCAWEYRCCTDPEIKVIEGGVKFMDQTGCIPYKQLALEEELYVDRLAVKQGRLRVDNMQAQACIAQVQMRACNNKNGTPAPSPMTMDACLNVFVGITQVGQPCLFAGECIAGSHCVSDKL